MSPISASSIASLRARTGVSITACKQALEDAGGNEEQAIDLLRKRGIAQAAKKAERMQKEGLVFVAQDGSTAALCLVRCETDFVARDAGFQEVGQEIARTLLTKGDAPARAIADERMPVLVQKFGENISIADCILVTAPILGVYIHSNQKIAVAIGLNGGSLDQARDVAMHAAAMSPLYRTPNDVTEEALEKEREIWREQLKKDGKPEAMFEKIMLGKEKKFREENALTTQTFVKDPSKTVAQYLCGATVEQYVRLSVL